jgi:hypothetical protein
MLLVILAASAQAQAVTPFPRSLVSDEVSAMVDLDHGTCYLIKASQGGVGAVKIPVPHHAPMYAVVVKNNEQSTVMLCDASSGRLLVPTRLGFLLPTSLVPTDRSVPVARAKF